MEYRTNLRQRLIKDPVSEKSLVANIAYDSRGLPIFDNVAKFTTKLDTSLSTNGQIESSYKKLTRCNRKGSHF